MRPELAGPLAVRRAAMLPDEKEEPAKDKTLIQFGAARSLWGIPTSPTSQYGVTDDQDIWNSLAVASTSPTDDNDIKTIYLGGTI